MNADNGCQRARKKPNHGLVLFLSLFLVTLTAPVWAQHGASVIRRWQELASADWPRDKKEETSSHARVFAAKIPFRIFEEKKPMGDPFIDAGADAQWQLAEAISAEKSSGNTQAKSTQPYPWPRPVDSVIEYGNAVHTVAATQLADDTTGDTESKRPPLTKLKLPSLGKGFRLPNLAKPKRENVVVPQTADGNGSAIPLANGVPSVGYGAPGPAHPPTTSLPESAQPITPGDLRPTPSAGSGPAHSALTLLN